MAGEKMQAFAAYLEDKNLFAENQFDYWMESSEMSAHNKLLSGGAILICRMKYDCAFYLERYTHSPDLIAALVSTWLMDNDKGRVKDGLEFPSLEVDMINERDASAVDLIWQITFIEDVVIVEDPNGVIDFEGKTYSLGNEEIDEATDFDVERG